MGQMVFPRVFVRTSARRHICGGGELIRYKCLQVSGQRLHAKSLFFRFPRSFVRSFLRFVGVKRLDFRIARWTSWHDIQVRFLGALGGNVIFRNASDRCVFGRGFHQLTMVRYRLLRDEGTIKAGVFIRRLVVSRGEGLFSFLLHAFSYTCPTKNRGRACWCGGGEGP